MLQGTWCAIRQMRHNYMITMTLLLVTVAVCIVKIHGWVYEHRKGTWMKPASPVFLGISIDLWVGITRLHVADPCMGAASICLTCKILLQTGEKYFVFILDQYSPRCVFTLVYVHHEMQFPRSMCWPWFMFTLFCLDLCCCVHLGCVHLGYCVRIGYCDLTLVCIHLG